MKKKILSALLLSGFIFVGNLYAQNIQVSAKMDSTNILIGEQTQIKLELTQDKNVLVIPPHINDTIVKGIEVLKVSNPDTVNISDQRITITQDLLITSFDSALYYIPPFKYISGTDTIYTNALALNVQTYEIDPESTELFDIKGIRKPPFVLKDYLGIIFIILLIIFLILAGYWLYKRWRNRDVNSEELLSEEDLLPPAVAARKAIEELKERKLWQNGFDKEYYSTLTDILRTYIERRFMVNAMEMTSSEIIDSLKNADIDKQTMNSLKTLLNTSDFVKFAKLKPNSDENQSSVMIAESFVDNTEEKIVEITELQDSAEVKEELNDIKKNDINPIDNNDSGHNDYMPKG